MNNKENQPVKLKPFVKWVGGKTQFLEIIQFLVPISCENFIEPFVGGGAVFLNIQPYRLIINDINQELITTYQVIKEKSQELIKLLNEYERKHNQEFYEALKKQEPKNLTSLEIAARFIYLNKTGYNGLYRVNGQGKFNVPFGQKEKVKLFDKQNILAISEYLNNDNYQILNQDYQQILPLIKENDFLFVDPPYDSENGNGFNSYTANKFTQKNQKELAQFLKKCEKKGAKWLLTNHATNFIKELYQDYWQFTFKAQRFINCQGDKRVEGAREMFIGNYQLTKNQEKELEFYQWFDSIQRTNISLEKLVNWENIQTNLTAYEKDLSVLNNLICSNQEELNQRIENIWQESPSAFQILPYLLAVRDGENLAWLEQEKIEYWDNLSLEKIKNLLFNSGLAEYLTNRKIKDLKDYCLGIEVGLGTHGRKNLGGKVMEKAVESLLIKQQIKYQKQVSVDFPVNGKKLFDFQIELKGKNYYLETSFFNVVGSEVQEVIRSYSGVLEKVQKNEINFLWILDGKGLKSCKDLLKDTYQKNKGFMFTLISFEEWLT
ncbi:MAG: Dam family site-specific DNA-(adenine-N6)-methyltransferase [Candidatus Moeniiplasma glomeromycotorum]|nr:Dam family site-specific DNA-(adenine-N6)-methyltransferase [Candidatus Moeniiplasma glomeromycotorum]MCE8168403.1 Dam family site-specific DNA-(adenine-N6)-methyltransferase [Candidatus Moeniiplasma glomeromycotorum]MCE8169713.1 Dam family site-specific DNA-(adenine-N6)-methyltransferase [Candidatus Moeniiplasma glomeromycotorum]